MPRTWILLAAAVAAGPAPAQPVIHHGPRGGGQPAGVIPAPTIPALGMDLSTLGRPPARMPLRPYLAANPYANLWGYAPLWPVWYDAPPALVSNYFPVPVPAPAPVSVTVVQPPTPVELRARLTLNVPPGAKVWLAGREIDGAVKPVVLESPVLADGQGYEFDVKVQWNEGDRKEERARRVTVEAGEGKSLTYLAAR